MARIIGEYSFVIPWQFLGLYSTSSLYKASPIPLQEVISHSDQGTIPGELGLNSLI
jgi:hypothetical protein